MEDDRFCFENGRQPQKIVDSVLLSNGTGIFTKTHNPRTTPSERKVCDTEEKKEKKKNNPNIVATFFGSNAHALLTDKLLSNIVHIYIFLYNLLFYLVFICLLPISNKEEEEKPIT
jgi:hypothetical protein